MKKELLKKIIEILEKYKDNSQNNLIQLITYYILNKENSSIFNKNKSKIKKIIKKLEKEFDKRIAKIVSFVTDEEGINRKERKLKTNLKLSNTTIKENLPAGTVIGTISTDSDTDSYYVISSDGSFIIEGNQLIVDQLFDFETKASYVVTIGARNSIGNSIDKIFDITIEDIDDELGVESFKKNQLTVTPNPSTGQFKVILDNASTGKILVTDSNGRIVIQQSFNNLYALDIDITTNASDLYILQIISNNNVTTKKLIKK
jgi:hypothetical protein